MSKSITKRPCKIDGCDRPTYGRGWCKMHYARWVRHGDPLMSVRNLTSEDRFWAKVNKTAGCWVWMGKPDPKGYGHIVVDGKRHPAHRLSWTMANGPVPYGMVVDHVCHNKSCVNPAHLRLATTKQNAEYRQGAQRNNRTSGVRGVYKAGKAWRVMVRHNQELHHFGCYPTVAEAEAVAIRERARLFTFPEYTCR